MTSLTQTSVTSFDDIAQEFEENSLNSIAFTALKTQFSFSGGTLYGAEYIGSGTAAYLVQYVNLGEYGSFAGGILLSTGSLPNLTNTETGFSFDHGLGGDDDLTASVKEAFSGAGETADASVLQFNFSVDQQSIDGIQFDIIFGSEEYPEYSDTSYVDIAAIYVNGKNYALFGGRPENPLSVLSANSAYLIDNTTSLYPIEWDGFTDKLSIRVPVSFGMNSVKIAIADTGDSIYDSGLYVQSIKFTSGGGLSGEPAILREGSLLRDIINVQVPVEVIDLGKGCDDLNGTLEQFNTDTFINFSFNDKIIFKNIKLNENNFEYFYQNGLLTIDADLDGQYESSIYFSGNYKFDILNVVQTEEDTEFNFMRGPGNPDGILPLFSFEEQLELIYIGYFNRAGDGSGYDFWLGESIAAQSKGQSAVDALNNIANAFRPQEETIGNYPLLGSNNLNFSDPLTVKQLEIFIDNVYFNLFERTPDEEGKAYWMSQIISGSVGFGSAILAIVNGAIGLDATIIMNKAETAFYFTANTMQAGVPSSASLFEAASSVIQDVDQDISSVEESLSKSDQFISEYSSNSLAINHSLIGVYSHEI